MLGSTTILSPGATWSTRSPVATTSAVYSCPMMTPGVAGCPGGTAKMWTSVPQIPAARTASRTSSGALSSGGSTSRTTSRPSPSNTAACIQPLRKSTQSSQSTQSNCFIHLQAPVETGETVKTGWTVLWLGTDHDLAVFALRGLLDRLHAVGQTETAGDDGGEINAAGGDEFDDVGKVTVPGVPLRAKDLGGVRLEVLQIDGCAFGGPADDHDLPAHRQGLFHFRNRLGRRAGCLDVHRGALPLRQLHDRRTGRGALSLQLDRVEDRIGADLLGQLRAHRRDLKRDDLGRPCGPRQGNGREANGAGAEDGHMSAGPEPSGAGEHRVVRDAGGLAERAGLIRPLHAAVAIRQGIDLPAVFGIDGDQVGLGAVDGEADLFQPLALVGIPVAAGRAFAAPDHLLAGDHVATPQIPDFLTHLHDLARKFVTDHDREAREARVQHVPIFVRLVEVHI